jgi:AcrR family transcriptional regulator
MSSRIEKQILAWAIKQFSSVGYHEISMSELAKLAEVTEGSIFRIFRTKDNLFDLAIKQTIAQVENDVSSVEFALARAEDFNSAIRHGVRRTHECFTPEFLRLRAIVFLEKRSLYPPFRHCVRLYERAFMRAIEREVTAGALREDLDPRITAQVVISHVIASKLFEERDRREATTELPSFVEILLRGIGKQGRRSPETRKNRG